MVVASPANITLILLFTFLNIILDTSCYITERVVVLG